VQRDISKLSPQLRRKQSLELFACRPKPLSDEMLSSWLLRIALQNGMKPQSFCNMLWPRQSFWNRSIDRYVSLEMMTALSVATATPLANVRQLSLASYEGVLFPAIVRNGNTPWVLPLGIFHRKFLRSGLVFCPSCLATGEPYFRRRWRFSFATVCLTHAVALQDSCPECLAPIQPHRVEMGNRNPYTVCPVYLCSTCRYDLRSMPDSDQAKSSELKCERASADLLKLAVPQLRIASEHFALLRHLLSMLASRRARLRPFREAVSLVTQQPIVIGWSHQENISLSFDAMPLAKRRVFLGAAYWLLEDWPYRFLNLARSSNLRISDLTRDFPNMPQTYAAMAAWL